MKDFTFSKRIKKASLFIPLLMLSLFFSQGINAQALSGAYTVDSSLVASSTNFVSISSMATALNTRSEEHTSELQSRPHLVCRLLLEKKKKKKKKRTLIKKLNKN